MTDTQRSEGKNPELSLPSDRVEGDGSRVDKFVREQRLVVASIQTRHFNPVSARVRPIQVLADPVHGHAFWRSKSYIRYNTTDGCFICSVISNVSSNSYGLICAFLKSVAQLYFIFVYVHI